MVHPEDRKISMYAFLFTIAFIIFFIGMFQVISDYREGRSENRTIVVEPNMSCAPYIFEQPAFFEWSCDSEGVCTNGLMACQQ